MNKASLNGILANRYVLQQDEATVEKAHKEAFFVTTGDTTDSA